MANVFNHLFSRKRIIYLLFNNNTSFITINKHTLQLLSIHANAANKVNVLIQKKKKNEHKVRDK